VRVIVTPDPDGMTPRRSRPTLAPKRVSESNRGCRPPAPELQDYRFLTVAWAAAPLEQMLLISR